MSRSLSFVRHPTLLVSSSMSISVLSLLDDAMVMESNEGIHDTSPPIPPSRVDASVAEFAPDDDDDDEPGPPPPPTPLASIVVVFIPPPLPLPPSSSSTMVLITRKSSRNRRISFPRSTNATFSNSVNCFTFSNNNRMFASHSSMSYRSVRSLDNSARTTFTFVVASSSCEDEVDDDDDDDDVPSRW